MIRKLMKTTFPRILDIAFVTSLGAVIVAAMSAGIAVSRYSFGNFFYPFISTLFIGLVGVVLAFGVAYLLLDIRDALTSKNNNLP